MTLFDYNYSISEDFPNSKIAIPRLTNEIRESEITVALDHIQTEEDVCEIYFKDRLSSLEEATLSSGIVANHSGEPLEEIEAAPVHIAGEYRDRHGKLRVHQTSRKEGLSIHWTGRGDDPSDPDDIGNGIPIIIDHTTTASGSLVDYFYIDFNTVDNETWVHEAILTWRECNFDTVAVEIVSRPTSFTISSGTNYSLYGGYLIVPAFPGTGNIQITGDITLHDGGLVRMPETNDAFKSASSLEYSEKTPAYWDAEWNSTTKRYENITPNLTGDGEFNMFAGEIVLNRLFNDLPMLGSGFQIFNSSDTDELGHGMRMRVVATTTPPDHDWSVSCVLVTHRMKTTDGA